MVKAGKQNMDIIGSSLIRIINLLLNIKTDYSKCLLCEVAVTVEGKVTLNAPVHE